MTESVLAAVDICFKSFWALQAKYPSQSGPIWTFIQQGIYEIYTPFDKNSTSVNELIADINDH